MSKETVEPEPEPENEPELGEEEAVVEASEANAELTKEEAHLAS